MDYLKDRVTIYEVAKASGVSLATVSRVINNQNNVTQKTKDKVNAVIKKLGYKPSGVAQALAKSKSTTIGVVVPSANYVYLSSFLNGITEVCREKGFGINLFVTSHSSEDAYAVVEKVITSHVDGVIIFDDALKEEDYKEITSYSVPTIVVNNVVEAEKAGCIVFGYEHKLKSILENHFKNGDFNKTPTFLHVHNCGRLLARTEKRFIEICEASNVKYQIYNVDDSYTRIYSDYFEFFKDHPNSKGYYIAYRDSIAAAIANAATDAGLHVPEDIEVLSLIGTKYSNICRPRITSMYVDMGDVGRRAMYMLTDLQNGQLMQKTYRIESEYQKRNTTKE